MKKTESEKPELSIVVTVSERVREAGALYQAFSESIEKIGKRFECIFILNVEYEAAWSELTELVDRHPECRAIRVRSVFTESDCLSIGFQQARADIIVTVPIYYQTDPQDLAKLLSPIFDGSADLTAASRAHRTDSPLNQWESRIYNAVVRNMTGAATHDLGSGVMVMRRDVAQALDIYGELFRFIPILAHRRGFRIREVSVRHVNRRKKTGVYGAGAYIRRLLDIFTLFFLIKFTKKPLRFFGLFAASCLILSLAGGVWITVERIAGQAAGNRPLLVLIALLAVLGIQLFSIGLIGELIIFTHARQMKEYEIEQMYE